jgi:hypothetical protein
MDFPHLVLARVYEHIEPIDRGDRYEDPLQATLETMGVGRVTGGGSQLNELGGIAHADVEIELANVDEALRIVAEALEQAGAPQGSELIQTSDGRVLREFGKLQCLAIYLDGTSLPDEVYANLDFEALIAALGAAADEDSYRGVWQGPEETGMFFFGPDAEAMFTRVEPVLRGFPIGQNARVVIRHGKQSLRPREVRMPRH